MYVFHGDDRNRNAFANCNSILVVLIMLDSKFRFPATVLLLRNASAASSNHHDVLIERAIQKVNPPTGQQLGQVALALSFLNTCSIMFQVFFWQNVTFNRRCVRLSCVLQSEIYTLKSKK